MKLVVTHPGRQHSHQAALALDREGMLAEYWSGVPAVVAQEQRMPAWVRRRFARYAPIPLEPGKSRWFPWTPALRRVGDTLLPQPVVAWNDFLACRWFDRWAAERLPRVDAGGVIACEISALNTFRAAKRLGMAAFLDAPSLHHQTQDRLHGTSDPPSLHRRICRIKDEEIELADHILTVSQLARRTYLEAGVPPEKVHAVALGADLELFAPSPHAEEHDEFVFLFAGATIRRKGFDLLLQAFARAAAAEASARLRIAGPRGDLHHLLSERRSMGITFLGARAQHELAAELRQADVLVLPFLSDSFGMVVAEALASGTPVLVSEMVGAKDLVAEGRTGWVVPLDDVNALADRMEWCILHRRNVRGMRPACRQAAEKATWPAYHRRLAELLRSLLG